MGYPRREWAAVESHENRWLRLRKEGLEELHSGRILNAEGVLRQALQMAREWDASDPSVAVSQVDLGELLLAAKRWVEAEGELRQAVALLEPLGAPYEPVLTAALLHLAEALRGQGRREEGERALDRAWVLMLRADARPRPAPEPPKPKKKRSSLRTARAELERVLTLWGPGDPRMALALREMAQACLDHQQAPEAAAHLRRAVAILEAAGQENYGEQAACLTMLAQITGTERTLDEAWVLLLKGDARDACEARKAAEAPYQSALQGILQSLKPQRALVLTCKAGRFALAAAHGVKVEEFWEAPPISLSLLGQVAQSGASVLLGDDLTQTQRAVLRMSGIRSLLCAPYWGGNGSSQIAGVLYADLNQGARSFTRHDLRQLSELARELETALP